MTEDPTHLIRRNFVQFSKVYQTVIRQLLYFITATTIKSTTNFKQLFVSSQTSSLNNISCCQNNVNDLFSKPLRRLKQRYLLYRYLSLVSTAFIHKVELFLKHERTITSYWFYSLFLQIRTKKRKSGNNCPACVCRRYYLFSFSGRIVGKRTFAIHKSTYLFITK